MWWYVVLLVAWALGTGGVFQAHFQYGPDPWNTEPSTTKPDPESMIPEDLRSSKLTQPASGDVPGREWFFKRLLVIILKNGSLKNHEDGSKEISIAMKLPLDQWNVLEEYINYEKPLTEEMYRRSVGYISDAIYRPSLTEKVVQAWSEYVLSYYFVYRDEITWILTILAIGISIVLMSKHMSRKILLIVCFILLYAYEGFVSFKELEKTNYDQFKTAVSRCNWRFWSSSCDMPMPDPLVFWKHMHPSRILIRMCAHYVTEPILLISSTVNQISNEITRDLWPPFNTIVNGLLIFFFNVMCIVLFVMFMCSFVLNMPFNVSLAGLISFGVHRRQAEPTAAAFAAANNTNNPAIVGDRLGGENLQNLLHILANAQAPPERQNVQNVVRDRRNGQGLLGPAREEHRARGVERARARPPARAHSAGRVENRAIQYEFVR